MHLHVKQFQTGSLILQTAVFNAFAKSPDFGTNNLSTRVILYSPKIQYDLIKSNFTIILYISIFDC